MKKYMYWDYNQVRHNSYLLMRKYYSMRKIKIKDKLATWGYITCTHTLFCLANLIDNNANNKVLDTFPGTIGLANDDNGSIVLNPKYRTNTDELHHYIS